MEQASQGTGPETWRRTDSLGMMVHAAGALRKSILPLLAVMFGSGSYDMGREVVLLFAALALGGNALFAWLGWRHHRYAVGADDIRVESGVLSRQARVVPYDRIQDVSLREPPLARVLGLVEVRFETGAGGKDEVTLAYVSRAEGEVLRNTVRARREGFSDGEADGEANGAAWAASGPEEAAAPATALFAMGLPRLIVFGVFEFSLVVLAVLFGAVQQLDFLFGFDMWDTDQWAERFAGPAASWAGWLAGLGLAIQVIGAIFALGSLIVIGLATGIVRTVLRDWGFRLDLTDRGLRRRRGLFTRSDMVMPLRRVQALKLSTGILRRHIGPAGGWHALHVVSLSQDDKSGSHVIAPFATLQEAARIAAVTGFDLPDMSPHSATRWHRTSARFHLHRALLAVVPLVLIALATWVAAPLLADVELRGVAIGPVWPMAVPLALAALQALRRWYLWRHDCFALQDGRILVRRGWLAPLLDIASGVRVQTVELVQGPLAQHGHYATLRFGIAGGTLHIAGMHMAHATALRDAVLAAVAPIGFSRLPR